MFPFESTKLGLWQLASLVMYVSDVAELWLWDWQDEQRRKEVGWVGVWQGVKSWSRATDIDAEDVLSGQ